MNDTPRTDAVARINEYLDVGGFFNPEILNVQQHEAVRDTLIQARDELNAANDHIKRLKEAIQERDKEWFQVIESILGFHPVSMTEALHIGIERIKKQNQRIKHLRDGISKQNQTIEQACGKVLGYPWFKDDQKNFPGANEKDGVCVGEHVAETIVSELAKRHTEALARIKRLEEAGDYIVEENDIHIGKEVWRKAKEAKP